MAAITEPARDADFLVSEANGTRSRDEVTIVDQAADVTLAPGTVLGIVTASGKYTPRDKDSVDGSEVAVGILLAETVMVNGADSSDRVVAVTRDAEVNAGRLTFDTGGEAGARTELLAVGIKVLDEVS